MVQTEHINVLKYAAYNMSMNLNFEFLGHDSEKENKEGHTILSLDLNQYEDEILIETDAPSYTRSKLNLYNEMSKRLS